MKSGKTIFLRILFVNYVKQGQICRNKKNFLMLLLQLNDDADDARGSMRKQLTEPTIIIKFLIKFVSKRRHFFYWVA